MNGKPRPLTRGLPRITQPVTIIGPERDLLMKPSRYNRFVDLEDGVLLAFNSASGALAEIEKEQRERVRYLLDHADEAGTDEDRQLVDALIEGGYIVPDDLDEIADFRDSSRSRRAQGTTMALTIAPTLACNFNCDYCFEGRSRGSMSPDIERAVLDFTDRRLQMDDIVRLRICWFGGEPTLRMPIVARMHEALSGIADKHGVEFPPGLIITNGYLLNGVLAQRLKDLNITNAQVTLDGPEYVHDRRRVLHNGKGTFRRIVDNLAEAAPLLNIRVRVNVDKDNVESAYEVIEALEHRGILPHIHLYFAQVKSYGEACVNIRDRCFCEEDFSRGLTRLYRKLIDMGVYKVDYPKVYGGVFCGAVAEGTYVISPNGLVFRCWEELSTDPAKSVGTIFSDELTDGQRQNLEAYRHWDPFDMPECVTCDILPLCLGGCPLHGMIKGVTDKGICSPWRFNLEDMLELRYRCETERQLSGDVG